MSKSVRGLASAVLGVAFVAVMATGCTPKKAEIDPAQMSRIEAAASKAEAAANKAEAAARSASEAASRADAAAQKAEAIFSKSMHKR